MSRRAGCHGVGGGALAGLHVSQLFRWRKQLCTRIDVAPTPESQALVPVQIVPDEGRPELKPRRRRRRSRSSVIEIEAPGGRRVRISGEVDAEALRRVLDVLERRLSRCRAGSGCGWRPGHTDMRKGFPGLALLVQETLRRDRNRPVSAALRGR